MKIQEFFRCSDGRMAKLYSLCSGNGFQIDVTDMGGALVSIFTPARDGRKIDVLLGYRDPAQYEPNPDFFGALIGRVANRIAFGHLEINGRTYALPLNDTNRPNTLHGGLSYGRRLWQPEVIDDQTLKLRLESPDGDAGFPGKINVEVTYRVTNAGELELNYSAVTDAPTVVNLTNHAYFNLNGEDALEYGDHEVFSPVPYHTEVNDLLIPTGRLLPTEGSLYDLSKGRKFEEILSQKALPIAFDDNFVIDEVPGRFRKNVFRVVSHRTGITLEMDTDQLGVQFYMGYWLDGKETGKCGKGYPRFSAFCLEAQAWPDAPNQRNFPSILLLPGQKYTQKTVYRFGVEA